MRQTFDIKGGPQDGRAHLPLLRKELGNMGLDGFYVPHDDEYQNEYLPDANERLAWVSAWADRPPQPMAEVAPYHVKYAGVAHDEKRAEIGKALEEDGIDAAVLTSPTSLAWAFNIRGGDVMCTPLPLGRAILHKDGTAEERSRDQGHDRCAYS